MSCATKTVQKLVSLVLDCLLLQEELVVVPCGHHPPADVAPGGEPEALKQAGGAEHMATLGGEQMVT